MSEFNQDYEHHSDPLDVSVAQQERILRAQLAVRRPIGPKFSGHCHNCGEPLQAPMIFCNGECREDHELRERLTGR